MSAGDWKELYDACEKGDISLVKYHLEMGVDQNYQHPEFLTTPLIESVRAQKLEVVEMLMAYGADPSIKEAWSAETAISIAKSLGDQRMIDVLSGA